MDSCWRTITNAITLVRSKESELQQLSISSKINVISLRNGYNDKLRILNQRKQQIRSLSHNSNSITFDIDAIEMRYDPESDFKTMISKEDSKQKGIQKEIQSIQQQVSTKNTEIVHIDGNINAKLKEMASIQRNHETESLKQQKKVDRMNKKLEGIRNELQSNNDAVNRSKEQQQDRHSEISKIETEKKQFLQNSQSEKVEKLKIRGEWKRKNQQLWFHQLESQIKALNEIDDQIYNTDLEIKRLRQDVLSALDPHNNIQDHEQQMTSRHNTRKTRKVGKASKLSNTKRKRKRISDSESDDNEMEMRKIRKVERVRRKGRSKSRRRSVDEFDEIDNKLERLDTRYTRPSKKKRKRAKKNENKKEGKDRAKRKKMMPKKRKSGEIYTSLPKQKKSAKKRRLASKKRNVMID